MTYDLTDEVKAIGSLNFEGNIIPIEWLNHVRLPNNKPDLVSIFLLSDIIYWYRPTTIRDEFSGSIIGYKKKFKSDLLQKGYNDLEDLFGLTKAQIKKSLQRLEKLADHSHYKRIIDKMPGNYNFVGLINAILPNAKIIHSRRHPIETCLSCYRINFAEGHMWTYNLRELGRNYRRYWETMSYWRKQFPDVMLEVRYEDNVADIESQAKKACVIHKKQKKIVEIVFLKRGGGLAMAGSNQTQNI